METNKENAPTANRDKIKREAQEKCIVCETKNFKKNANFCHNCGKALTDEIRELLKG